MADQNILHTAEILKAALPFIDSGSRSKAEFFTKTLDLMGSLKAMTGNPDLAACGYEGGKIDVEGLLTGIRPLCNNKEREFVDRILNIFNIKRMFEMYNNFMSTMKTMQEYGGFPFGASESGDSTDSNTGNFAGFNFDSIFGNFANNSSTDTSSESEQTFNSSNPFDQDVTNDSVSGKDQSPPPAGNKGNNGMIDMLKAMMPPEQMSTFENLSMLLNTMSYDNNSKADENKECNDG